MSIGFSFHGNMQATQALKRYPVISVTMSRQKALTKSVQIRIGEDTYRRLIQKGNLADTFDTVIQRLLEKDKNGDEAN